MTLKRCRQLVQQFLEDPNPECQIVLGGDIRMIQLSFSILKAEVLKAQKGKCPSNEDSILHCSESQQTVVAFNQEQEKMTDLLKQRDDEVCVLLKMLKQEKRRAAEAESSLIKVGSLQKKPSSPILGKTSPIELRTHSLGLQYCSDIRGVKTSEEYSKEQNADITLSQDTTERRSTLKIELSQARQEAFDMYRKNIADMTTVDSHKKILKAKYAEAKHFGDKVNASRLIINNLKSKIEKLRISRGIQGLADGYSKSAENPNILKENELKGEVEMEKKNFKVVYDQLRALKTEIEHVQHLHEKAKLQIQRSFEQWWHQMVGKKENAESSFKDAWRTPTLPSTSSEHDHISVYHTPEYDKPLSSPQHDDMSIRPLPHHHNAGEHVAYQNVSDTVVSHHKLFKDVLSGDNCSRRLASPLSLDGGPDSKESRYATSFTAQATTAATLPSAQSIKQLFSKSTQPSSLSPKIAPASYHSKGDSVLTQQIPLFQQTSRSSGLTGTGESHGSIRLTGDPKADADIKAFYKARQKLIQKGHPS